MSELESGGRSRRMSDQDLRELQEQQKVEGRLRALSRSEIESSEHAPRLVIRQSSFEPENTDWHFFNLSTDSLPCPNESPGLGSPNAQEQVSDVVDADTPTERWLGGAQRRSFNAEAFLPVDPPNENRKISRTKSAALPSKSSGNNFDLSPMVTRTRSSSEVLTLQQALSLHFNGRPLTLVPSPNNSLSPMVLPNIAPTLSPQLSALPSVQLSVGGFSDVPDVDNEDILNCANIIFALFYAIAPRDSERNVATMICDYAYLCNHCKLRSPQLHYCNIHTIYECPDCWRTQCCHHNGSCTECRRICPNCERESCKHCFGENATQCDRCCLSLPGFGEDIVPISIPMNDEFTPDENNNLVIINDHYSMAAATPDYSDDPNNAIIEPDSDSEFDLSLFTPLPTIPATDASGGPSASDQPMH